MYLSIKAELDLDFVESIFSSKGTVEDRSERREIEKYVFQQPTQEKKPENHNSISHHNVSQSFPLLIRES